MPLATASMFVLPEYEEYVKLYDALEPETQAWVLNYFYRYVLEPRMPTARFLRKVTSYSRGEMARMHNEALSRLVSNKPEDWRLELTDELVCDTPTPHRPFNAPFPPISSPYSRPDNPVPNLATDITCHLHPTALLLCEPDLRNDRRSLVAVYDGVYVDVMVRILWRLQYELNSPLRIHDDDHERLLQLVTESNVKYAALFDERYQAIDRYDLERWQRERYLHLYMTSHLGHEVQVEHNGLGESVFHLLPGGMAIALTTGIMIDWVHERRNQDAGGIVVVATTAGDVAAFEVTGVEDMDFVPQGGFIFRDGYRWPSIGHGWDMRAFRFLRPPTPDPDEPNGGLGPFPLWAPGQILPIPQIERVPCPYHPAHVCFEDDDD
ncbi:hypothetical protein ABEF92_005056 [Exophiala dermatitidis]|uniref:Uncharacterized protein n=1 Tax=Exophiala dermatitidis (strain ATCC 34100 / CBS 525.76 / NIH/UT8656) TaxID=858893 RepID=H6CAY3_EXODN|nr:uncharacterized protein HMPREF1120_08873 [Exophiala dermatitidis NIH/UT8656]EHY60930.1 hypothetical protein HMPREF1120_08873 [Exophiala dermatitidis NIH/UT8656]